MSRRVLIFGSPRSGVTGLTKILQEHIPNGYIFIDSSVLFDDEFRSFPSPQKRQSITSPNYYEKLINQTIKNKELLKGFDIAIQVFKFSDIGTSSIGKGTSSVEKGTSSVEKGTSSVEKGTSSNLNTSKKGEIKDIDINIYNNIVNKLFQNKIPCLLVVTHTENEENFSGWLYRNWTEFSKNNMYYFDMIGGCAIEFDRYLYSFYPDISNVVQKCQDSTVTDVQNSLISLEKTTKIIRMHPSNIWNIISPRSPDNIKHKKSCIIS